MEYVNENEIEEGIINNIPNSINISNKFIDEKKSSSSLNNLIQNISSLNSPIKLTEKDFKNNHIYNTDKHDKYKYSLKFEDSNSATTKYSINDKIKKVTFSTVEIIRVANYKKYNKLNNIKKGELNNSWINEINCSIF